MNVYQFEKIFSHMAKEFGKIARGKEKRYFEILMTDRKSVV